MTTDAMNCERFANQLMEYLEHDVDVTTRATVEHHAGTCADCGALLADGWKLRVDAANLPALAPSRDLWSGIAARIETPVVPIGANASGVAAAPGTSRGGGRRMARRWLNAGLIAASLVTAAMIGYGARDVRRELVQQPVVPANDADPSTVTGGSDDGSRLAQVPSPSSGSPESGVTPDREVQVPAPAASLAVGNTARAPEVQLAVARLTADYDREIARLRVLIDQRRSQLDPMTVSVIERNLAVIDTAIAESRRAIASDPSSRFLIEFLNQSLQDKVELMRTAALLPSRT
jgi:hypothetical protein